MHGHGVLGNKVPSTELAHPVELQAALALVNMGLRVVMTREEATRKRHVVKILSKWKRKYVKRSHLELGDAREDGGTVSADVTLEIRFE